MLEDPVKNMIRAYDKLSQKYVQFWGESTCMEKALKCFLTEIPAGSLILDLGCGVGRDMYDLLREGYSVVGVDLSMGMLHEARGLAPEVRIGLMDIRQLALKSATFDGVWANASLLHIPSEDLVTAICETRRVMKIGAELFLSMQDGAGEVVDPDGRLFVRYSQDQICTLIVENGFYIEDISLIESTNNTYQHNLVIRWFNIYARAADVDS
ncbi:MAG: class I SAM-dependent methyltransferase [Deltaproteobacteria bacterium]|nr:class I SAM-dependent methyltransferase [Deltaproteobacteria bacterium]